MYFSFVYAANLKISPGILMRLQMIRTRPYSVIFCHWTSRRLLAVDWECSWGSWANKYQSNHFCSCIYFYSCVFPIRPVSLQKTWLCVRSGTSLGSHRLTHVVRTILQRQLKPPEKFSPCCGEPKELTCLHIVSSLNLMRHRSLVPWGGSDSLLSATGPVHTLCIYI